MTSLNIGYIVSSLENSGPINILYNIVKYLNNVNIYIYTLKDEKKNTKYNEFIKLGCRIKKLEINNKEILMGKIDKVEKNFRNLDLLHSHCFKSTLLLSKIKNKKIKKISTLHANVRLDYNIKFGLFQGKIMEILYFNALKKLDLNIACSKSIMKYYENDIRKLKYIQNGVDMDYFKSNTEIEKDFLRKKLNLEDDKIYFISVGSLCKRKDPMLIVNEFKKIKNDKLRLIFLGDGAEKIKIENSKDLRIILKGKVDNVKDYLNASDFFISASKSEGLPNSVLEALALKVPVILSNINSHQEILEVNTDAGLLFDRNINGDLKEKIEVIIERNYEELQKNSYFIIEKELNSRRMSEKYLKEYRCIIQG